jgi:hypothetical protein
MIDHSQVLKDFTYDKKTGKLYANKRAGGYPAGREAGCLQIKKWAQIKYRTLRYLGTQYPAHRFIWFYVYGEWPKNHIDHIDGNGLNNRMENLRDVTQGTNRKNNRLQVNNRSGYPGVSWYKRKGKWQVKIKVDTKFIWIGYFHDLNEAIKAKKEAELEHGFHQNHGRS